MNIVHTTGRRKTAVTHIYLKADNGTITVDKRELNNYFTAPTLQYEVKQALALVGAGDTYNVKVSVYGGGITGQAEATRLVIVRTLYQLDAENRATLKPEGLLARDPRTVKRKKFSQKKARKRSQFPKRQDNYGL